MKIDLTPEIINSAWKSKCVVCGGSITRFQLWKCSVKDKTMFFAHTHCLYPSKYKNRKQRRKEK